MHQHRNASGTQRGGCAGRHRLEITAGSGMRDNGMLELHEAVVMVLDLERLRAYPIAT
ncbi:hypothetical protein KZO85_04480 [Chromohalobacter canadensis]|uniref:Uncharacterized protein n=1 Tax=Chromohalobacter canadensis TaxID=141389 RepID=A0A285VYG9_9GAMM|nr:MULTISPECIES: hypothetical protein [Chromohalobacter]MCT8467825.1 hypothetical protein [Chromohalobacter canadensis]MCT8470427.1 hypothetical protein [Chromohalobacter canadensis]MCT8498322.1 hypothetical protein [Chromohalobacter canadensis]SOC58306.1 hypothetical protein SAMN05421509_11710 [Chromohalobacter canadensis]